MDGVLIDSEPIHQEIQALLFKKFDISLSRQEYQQFIGRSSKNMWEELKRQFHLSISVDQILLLDKQMYHRRLQEEPGLTAIPGIPELLRDLKHLGTKLAVASSSSMESINLVLSLLKLEDYFPHRISGATLEKSKPDPLIFHKAAAMLESKVDECLVIEDSTHGVSAALNAGMPCIGYQNPNSGNQDLSAADQIISSFKDIDGNWIIHFRKNRTT